MQLADQGHQHHCPHLRYEALEIVRFIQHGDLMMQGVAGLSARDIKLIVDGGFNTVESVAYTYVLERCNRKSLSID